MFPRPALLAALAAATSAQVTVTVPAALEQRDGPAMGEMPGFSNGFRQQVVLRDRLLGALEGKTIVALTVRRDGMFAPPLRGGRCTLTLALGTSACDPTLLSPEFADNVVAPVTVFDGVIELPSAAALPGRDGAGWAPPHALTITFTTPFPYRGGHLLIDAVGAPDPAARAPIWPIDFDAGPAATASVGMAGRPGDLRVNGAIVSSDFNPGGDVSLISTGPVGTACIAMVAPTFDEAGLDLAGWGSPGSRLHLTPVLGLPAVYPREKANPLTRVQLRFAIPLLTGVMGAAFAVQWLQAPNETKPAGWATTQLVRVRLGHAVPSCDVASVRSGPNAAGSPRGAVLRHVGPVLRFTTR